MHEIHSGNRGSHYAHHSVLYQSLRQHYQPPHYINWMPRLDATNCRKACYRAFTTATLAHRQLPLDISMCMKVLDIRAVLELGLWRLCYHRLDARENEWPRPQASVDRCVEELQQLEDHYKGYYCIGGSLHPMTRESTSDKIVRGYKGITFDKVWGPMLYLVLMGAPSILGDSAMRYRRMHVLLHRLRLLPVFQEQYMRQHGHVASYITDLQFADFVISAISRFARITLQSNP